ncbi:MAG: hypothetical protein ACMUJM_20635 [bacterium]
MKKLILIIIISLISLSASAQNTLNDTVFRETFTLKLHVDKGHYYEEKFDRIPYIHNNAVYLFAGESFGINLQMENQKIKNILYQKDIDKADIDFRFSQEIEKDGSSMMMLVIKNKTKNKIFMDALMTIPGKKGIYQTTILPLMPGLSGYESWPHPIVQLVLKDIRLKK